MIAKNEEDWIANCIQSVSSIICETILIDTGSTDKTVEIAEGLGATVFHKPWKDDFSAPRNISLEMAKGEWILILDADEAIAQSDLEGLQKLTLDRNICWEFLQRHYSNDHRMSNYFPVRGEFPEMEKNYAGFFESNLYREEGTWFQYDDISYAPSDQHWLNKSVLRRQCWHKTLGDALRTGPQWR